MGSNTLVCLLKFNSSNTVTGVPRIFTEDLNDASVVQLLVRVSEDSYVIGANPTVTRVW